MLLLEGRVPKILFFLRKEGYLKRGGDVPRGGGLKPTKKL